jgi:hypothetical protein
MRCEKNSFKIFLHRFSSSLPPDTFLHAIANNESLFDATKGKNETFYGAIRKGFRCGTVQQTIVHSE